MNAVIDELTWRGLIAHSTDLEALAAELDAGPIAFYVGFDPTAPSIHFGNLVQLMVARRLQAAGHKPYLLVGGSTGLIGDPKEAGERRMNPVEMVHGWVEKIRAQVGRFVDLEGENAAVLVNNYDWTANLGTLDFLRDVGKHFSVNKMLARDVVANRLESGISYAEFSYMLLQSLDYRELHRRHNVVLQTGGSDQWGNITAGVELVRRSDGDRVHALATPLLTKADGTKFGKTEAGTVWLDAELTSPYAFHQFFLNSEDAMVVDYLKVFSDRSRDEIEQLGELTRIEPHRRAAQRALADDITNLVHGREQRLAAVQAAEAVFGRADLAEIDESTLAGVAAELPSAAVSEPCTITDALAMTKVVASKSAARRAVDEGGAYLNNQKVTDHDQLLGDADFLHGRFALVRRGKKTVGVVVREH